MRFAERAQLNPDEPHSPVYLAGRREWNERYGSYISQRDSWRLAALGAIGVAMLAVGGLVYVASKARIAPYVVQTDKLGDAIAISRADVAAPADPRIIRSQLASWISNVRTVLLDVRAEKRSITKAYAMVDRSGAANQILNDWFAAHDPFKRAQDEMVSVDVASVLPLSGDTWRVEWREDRRTRQGAMEPSENWQATITISINPPSTDAAVLANPIGLFVSSFNWSQRSSLCDGRPC